MAGSESIIPVQPGIACLSGHRERLVAWNPYSKKNQALCYQFETGAHPDPIELYPDACVDFIVKCDPDNPELVINGVQTTATKLELTENTTYFGFKPYSVNGMRLFDFKWSEAIDHRSVAENLTGGGFDEAFTMSLIEHGSFDERVSLVRSFARDNLSDPDYVTDLAEYEELQVCQAKGNLRMGAISDATGYSDRWCRSKFKESIGMSIKCYSSIIRFQNAMRMLLGASQSSIADVVFDNGYFDQSHLTRDFRKFAGETPARFCRRRECVA